jgi:hypothetical protein
MPEVSYTPMVDLPSDAQAALVAGARDREPVRGLTHGFYKYPARFSPSFARATIEIFTQPGESRYRRPRLPAAGIATG